MAWIRDRAPTVALMAMLPDGPWPVKRGGWILRLYEHSFESFQNWQSEFLAIASIVWLAVYLRQRWSPESKPVPAPHAETGR